MRAYLDLLQRAVVLCIAMILALCYRTGNAMIGVAINVHLYSSLFGVKHSLPLVSALIGGII